MIECEIAGVSVHLRRSPEQTGIPSFIMRKAHALCDYLLLEVDNHGELSRDPEA